MNVFARIGRHARLTFRNYGWGSKVGQRPAPPFVILFINSICNQTCEHCFYWKNLNRRDDLTVDEMRQLSEELGPIDNLNLSGGEPFLRKEFAEICGFFIRNNGVKQIYVPTNGSFKDRTVDALRAVLKEPGLDLFAVEFSLDGMSEFHDVFRGMKDAFARSMETYDALVELQKEDPRLRLHAISTATSSNLDEIRRLTEYLYERCPEMDHHNLALIRGDRKNPTLQGPALAQYHSLYRHVRTLWAPREQGRYGAIVEPMLQWAKTRTAIEQRQVIPCRAGNLSTVIYANGDVSFCETHAPLGNLRQSSFTELWNSPQAAALRASVANKECHCTNEVFLWPSIVFQPAQLLKVMLQSQPWKAADQDDAPSLPPPSGAAPPLVNIR